MPNVLSPRDLVFRPDNMDETVPHTYTVKTFKNVHFQNRKSYDLETGYRHAASGTQALQS